MKKTIFFIFACAIWVAACSPKMGNTVYTAATKPALAAPADSAAAAPVSVEQSMKTDEASAATGDAPAISDSLPVYRASAKRVNDLVHTKLEVSFDWQKQQMPGKAVITLKPHFAPTDSLELDAKSFDVHSVTFEGQSAPLKYEYDGLKLTIHLGRTFTRNDTYKIAIDYTAKPNEGPMSGSAAITSDKGLYFINADGADPDKPRQIWTQGESESNSKWFPTIDKPNQKMTDEIFITVDSKYKTLSNGLMASSKPNADGTRTDRWVMDQKHAPYLVMMAIGDFNIVKDYWNGIEVSYYMEPKYEKYAKTIFKNSPEILSFYSDRLGVKYPWKKLAHVAVHDYVSGAMENTSAILYGEFMNGTDRELIDNDQNELVEAHEMFHQWFGDLVTAESWSNLTVNESFADYSEYLWTEHKYGADQADAHLQESRDQYLVEAGTKMHPLVYFKYDSREDMFDRHTYNKGGCILNMLRNYTGDDAYFASLKKYLTDNQFGTGEAQQLRLAFEDVTGEDMNWFWNQWYYKAGHPILDITYAYDAAAKKTMVTIEQTQKPRADIPAVFELPIKIDVYSTAGQAPKRYPVRITERKQTFAFDAAQKPALVNVDADKMLLCIKNDHHSDEEWAFMFYNAPKYLDRWEAMDKLTSSQNTAVAKEVFDAGLKDPFYGLRQKALENVSLKEGAGISDKIVQLAEKDPRMQVRSSALKKLATTKDVKYAAVYKNILENERAYPVLSSAMTALYQADPTAGTEYVKRFENETNPDLLAGVGAIYAQNPNATQTQFFEKNLSKITAPEALIGFIGSYGKVIQKMDTPAQLTKLAMLKQTAVDQNNSPYRRFGSARAINEIRLKHKASGDEIYKATQVMMDEIKSKETNPEVKSAYEAMTAN